MTANETRETELSTGDTRTPVGLLILRPAMALLYTAVSISVLLVLRGREPFVPPPECYTTRLGTTHVCKDMVGQLEWVMWPISIVAAGATIFVTAHSVRLYFRDRSQEKLP